LSKKEDIRKRLNELIEKIEKDIRSLLDSERSIKSFGIDNLSDSVKSHIEVTLERSKKMRSHFAMQLGRMDRAKRKLEDL
jgi:arsenate reductase-like glutaredoxin family protein